MGRKKKEPPAGVPEGDAENLDTLAAALDGVITLAVDAALPATVNGQENATDYASFEGYESEPALAVRRSEVLALRQKRIAIANILRSVRRPDGRELSDVAVAFRVGGVWPHEVAVVRAELVRQGVLTEELDQGEKVIGGGE